jgi:hypothetical protein
VKWPVVCLALCLWSCAGTETGNPSFDGTLGYDAYSSQPAQVALRAADVESAPIHVESAWLVLGNVSFLGPDECDGNGELGHAKGLGAGDHVGSQAATTPFELHAAKLCGVRLPIAGEGKLPDAAPPELAAHSILITGTRDAIPFRIASSVRADVLLRADSKEFELDDDRSGVLIGFDVAAWLADLDWSGAAPLNLDESGTFIVDAEHNPSQLTAFEARIGAGVALFRDRDGDGLLDRGSTPIAHSPE